MNYLLFFFYLLVCCWLLTKIRFVKNAGLAPKIIIGIFLLKLAAGILNGWLMSRTSYLADTWMYHSEGLKEYHLLFSDPKEYFSNFFRSSYSTGYDGFFQSSNSYWNDLRSNLIIKLLSIFDMLSFGNYYTNVIFYNFIVFFGNIGLFRVFDHIYKGKKILLAISCFLLPSALYFSSSIHKEGLILAAIGIIVFNIYYSLNYSGFIFRRVIYILLSLCFIFLLRNFIFIAIIPAIIAWIVAYYKKQISALLIFLAVYLISSIIFFVSGNISPRLNLPEKVVARQQSFFSLEKAATDIPVDSLKPSFKSFVSNTPQSLNHSLLRPYWDDISLSKSLLPFAAEFFLYELIIILFVFLFIKNKQYILPANPFILFGLFFSFSVFLMTGYTIPILGAIVRYRSIYLPFILVPVFCNFPGRLFNKQIQIKK